MTHDELDKILNEQDNAIEKLQRRIEALERANLDVLAFLRWKAQENERTQRAKKTTTRSKHTAAHRR